MRHTEPLQAMHRTHSLAYSLTRSHCAHLTTQLPHGLSRGPLGTAHGGHRQRLLPGRAGLHARAGAALGPFDVARFSERTDEQELRMNGDETAGGSPARRIKIRSGRSTTAHWHNGQPRVASVHSARQY
jgi:hypothetical protein